MMSLDSIVIEIIILNIFNTVQLSFVFFFFPHERDLNVFYSIFFRPMQASSVLPPSRMPDELFTLWDRHNSTFPNRLLLLELLSVAGQYFTSIYVSKGSCKSQLYFMIC